MLAFVLSGGGNRGAQQAGALQVLLDQGLKPDLLIGTSAGALNAAFLAANPTPAGAHQLAQVWEQVTQDEVYPGNFGTILWRLFRRHESFYPNTNLHRFIRLRLRAAHLLCFADLKTGPRLYIVAAHLDTGAAHVFGDDLNDSVVDALMASTAMPPLHPPWRYRGTPYIDGAFVADLPIRLAVERGAREIYALNVTRTIQPTTPLHGVRDITLRAIDAYRKREVEVELEIAQRYRDVVLHYVPLVAEMELPFWDFSHARTLIQAGQAAMQAHLKEQPRRPPEIRKTWLELARSEWIRAWGSFGQRAEHQEKRFNVK